MRTSMLVKPLLPCAPAQDGPGSLDLDRMAANLVELHEHRQRAQAERDRLDRAGEGKRACVTETCML